MEALLLVALVFVLVLSGITTAAYWLDKRAALKARRRIPETTLHLLSLLGGSPGATFSQQFFRHKRRKRRFMLTHWAIVLMQLATLGWVIWLAN